MNVHEVKSIETKSILSRLKSKDNYWGIALPHQHIDTLTYQHIIAYEGQADYQKLYRNTGSQFSIILCFS